MKTPAALFLTLLTTAGRSYTLKTSENLSAGSWITLPGGSITNNGDQRTVTDPAASATRKFYTVEIVKP